MLPAALTWHKVASMHTLKELHFPPEALLVREELADHRGVAAPTLGREHKGIAATHLSCFKNILACSTPHACDFYTFDLHLLLFLHI